MGKQINYYNKVLDSLKELHKKYPNFNMGRHLSSIFSDYGDPWGITDKELYFAIEKYELNLEAYGGIPLSDDKELERIIREGNDLNNILNQINDDADEDSNENNDLF